jgi:glycosyltransferase involved in cell wall biosynthesis
MASPANSPLFSVFSILKQCASREAMLRRSIESVLSQTITDFEFVIQDGGSTDGTMAVIKSYGDPRIRFCSEPDSCAEEALFRALRRCRGTFVGSCFSDEMLLPDALEKATGALNQHAAAAAIYGNCWLMNDVGERRDHFIPKNPFSLGAYACAEVVPPFCATFFRRDNLERAGLQEHAWRYGMGEYELWIRVAGTGSIAYVPIDFSEFGVGKSSLTRFAAHYDKLVAERVRRLPTLFAENPALREAGVAVPQAIAGQYTWAAISVHPLEGLSPRCRHFLQDAWAIDPDSRQLQDALQCFGVKFPNRFARRIGRIIGRSASLEFNR